MKKRLVDSFPFTRVVTVCAVALAIGLGLCGLSAVFSFSSIRPASLFIGPSLVLIVLSFLGMLVTLLAWVIAGAIDALSGRSHSGPQTLFGDSDDDPRS
jgi:hypothetical protein